VAPRLEEAPPVLVDDVRMEPRELALARPAFGEVEQVRADAQAASLRMDAGLVFQVGEIALVARPGVRDDPVVAKRNPGVGLQPRLVERPPLAQLVAGEADRVLLVEVETVADV
jgi:hypothetical protein